jgi:hypothetical protein
MNRWNIPDWLEKEIYARDVDCVYCGVIFGSTPGIGSHLSWEHIVNDVRIITRNNIALCCRACNSSKGPRLLAAWLGSAYCLRRGISGESVADVVKLALENRPRRFHTEAPVILAGT